MSLPNWRDELLKIEEAYRKTGYHLVYKAGKLVLGPASTRAEMANAIGVDTTKALRWSNGGKVPPEALVAALCLVRQREKELAQLAADLNEEIFSRIYP